MLAAYGLLSCLSMGSVLIGLGDLFSVPLFLSSFGMAYYSGIANFIGLSFSALLCFLSYLYFKCGLPGFARFILFLLIVCTAGAVLTHSVPGFFNELILDRVRLSSSSVPFSLYLNFDKLSAALIIYLLSDFRLSEKSFAVKSLRLSFIVLFFSIIILLPISYLTGFIDFDPKFPDIFYIWAFNNFVFVCVSEEIFFRGFLQNSLKSVLKGRSSYFSILLVSLIFGVAHFKAGILYSSLAFLGSCFYGYIYDRTGKIFYPVLVHFGLNATHFLFFSYPSVI